MPVTTLYLALAVVIFSALSLSVIRSRRKHRILIGDGEDEEFVFVHRAHANFSEYVPITLIAIAAAESSGAHLLLLHIAGVMLISGRLIHAHYCLKNRRSLRHRVLGMRLTFYSLWIATATAAGYSLWDLI